MANDPFAAMSAPDYPATCDLCGTEGTNESMLSHACNGTDRLMLTFQVTVTDSRAALVRQLGTERAKQLHAGGAVYLNDLVPEFDYDSSEIVSVETYQNDSLNRLFDAMDAFAGNKPR